MAWVQGIYDTLYDPNTVCVACISHGKDSLAMLRAIKLLGLPLHRIVTTDVWATQDIPAVLPEMWEWKTEADKIIKELYGIEVEHICAMQKTSDERCLRLGYEDMFYHKLEKGKFVGTIKGFPQLNGSWCQKLKYEKVDIRRYILSTMREGRKINIVQYLGIAADEPLRIARHIKKPNVVLPLVEIGWDEDLCGLIAGYQNLLSPTYNTATRDGCWFCHNQGVDQLRNLRKNHPDLWALLLKWDADSPVTFKPDGHTVKDFDERFALEDQGLITPSEHWKWAYLNDMPIQLKMNF
jgi:hypothetical protein